jgi:hypothetical protein
VTTVPTIEEMKAQIVRGAEIERRASTGWFALLYKTCAEASKARGFSLYDAYDAPDWKVTIEATFPNGCGQLFHKTADGGITGLPGFVEASADDIRFMEFARAFVPIAIRFIEAHLPFIEAHLPEIEKLDAARKSEEQRREAERRAHPRRAAAPAPAPPRSRVAGQARFRRGSERPRQSLVTLLLGPEDASGASASRVERSGISPAHQ